MGTKGRGRRANTAAGGLNPGGSTGEVPVADRSAGAPAAESPAGLSERREWSAWARLAVSTVLLFHLTAILFGALGVPPSSMLERKIADAFMPYYGLLDLGYAYRFYAEPPPTPVVTATLTYTSRPDETVRLPGRVVAGPRMRHQRQLALANALFLDVQEAKQQTGNGSQSLLARAYARHLCMARPGCKRVVLHLQQHLIPEPDQIREQLRERTAASVDLFAESLFTTPEWIGEYSCGSF
jgi:hypothetical protein